MLLLSLVMKSWVTSSGIFGIFVFVVPTRRLTYIVYLHAQMIALRRRTKS